MSSCVCKHSSQLFFVVFNLCCSFFVFVFLAGLPYKTAACQSVCRIAQNCCFLQQQKTTVFLNKLLNQVQEKQRIIDLMAFSCYYGYCYISLSPLKLITEQKRKWACCSWMDGVLGFEHLLICIRSLQEVSLVEQKLTCMHKSIKKKTWLGSSSWGDPVWLTGH